MSLPSGTRLGPYQVVDRVGAGGMGEVYKATDTRLGRTVAVKVLPAHVAADPALRARLEREAKAISSLNHPHICTLYDIGHQDGTDFLVMEYLEGETLAQRLEQGPLRIAQALQTGIEIADALDKAHRQGIVHRDLKPGNVMLTKSGAKLLDFGLAKLHPAVGGAGLSAAATVTSPLTGAGSIVGTYQYMSPEQLEGREADERSDIFAFGALLYEMISGTRAFTGTTQASVIASILKDTTSALESSAPVAANSRRDRGHMSRQVARGSMAGRRRYRSPVEVDSDEYRVRCLPQEQHRHGRRVAASVRKEQAPRCSLRCSSDSSDSRGDSGSPSRVACSGCAPAGSICSCDPRRAESELVGGVA